MLRVQQVTKRYSNHLAVDRVSFEMPDNAIMGLLGPNGAGKSTLLRMITTITMPDSGQIFFDGEPLARHHISEIGYMPEERGLYKKMKVGEHLIFLARLKGLSPAEARKAVRAWMEKFGILDWWNKKIQELSKGMQQKIQFIATVVHRPKLLIFDEPFSGLDPINTNLIKDEILQLHREGTGVIFSTHRMEQVEELCDYVVLINEGHNILEGRVQDIKEAHKKHIFEINYTGQIASTTLQRLDVVERQEGRLVVHLPHDTSGNTLLRTIVNEPIEIISFREIYPSFNEIFIDLVEEKVAS